ncbi:NAD(P)/FAD-dependent oxidoreductase [Pseudalkalibacillus hwajinpoensis]|uniref:dihydrolipoyl dehydrogenase family protein n=1 Tax=Guptibacillus hwajinpoensis TaxID=208199 RepID=UPI00325B4AD3
MVVGEIIHEKDLVVIGAGPAGYEAAIRAAEYGRDVTLVDRSKAGGACLHSGCIPSKLLAISARKMWETAPGVRMERTFSMTDWQSEKTAVIESLKKGLHGKFKSQGIELVTGSASFLSKKRLGVEQGEKFEVWTFQNVILATGSTPRIPIFLKEVTDKVIPIEGLYNLPRIPRKLIIFGADTYSTEAASSFQALGADVTLITEERTLMGELDESIGRELKRQFKKQEIRVIAGAKDIKVNEDGELLSVAVIASGEPVHLSADTIGFSSGRNSNVQSLGLKQADITLTEDNHIEIKETCETSISGIYACGDITLGAPLAAKAIQQGKTAADHCCGVAAAFSLDFIPTVVHTQTPISSVGLTEREAVEAGYEVSTKSLPMRANGYAALNRMTEGVVKVIRDQESHLLLGFHVMGAGAVELIEKATLALEMAARDEDFTYPYVPHPGFGELWTEAIDLSIQKIRNEEIIGKSF